MKKSINLSEATIIEPQIFSDDRGYFFESYNDQKYTEVIGFKPNFIQDNESKSNRGILRGLHYQLPPFAQSKLVRVIMGSVIDVAVDIRKGSPTFGSYMTVELSDINKKQLFIPRGFAHGFIVLSEVAIFSYKVDNYYSAKHDRGIIYNDTEIGVDWNMEHSEILLSDKDKNHPSLSEAEVFDFASKLY